MLDTLPPTATGLEMIPAWLLRLGAPSFAAPLAQLFQQSLAAGVAPSRVHHASLLEVARAVPRPEVYLPGLASTQSDTRLQGPVRVQVVRLNYCCNRCDYAHRALNVEQQRLRSTTTSIFRRCLIRSVTLR